MAAPNLTPKQAEAIQIAQWICNQTAGNHNKCKTLLAELPDATPERFQAAMPQLKALLFVVDDYHAKAIQHLTAALNDKDYPT